MCAQNQQLAECLPQAYQLQTKYQRLTTPVHVHRTGSSATDDCRDRSDTTADCQTDHNWQCTHLIELVKKRLAEKHSSVSVGLKVYADVELDSLFMEVLDPGRGDSNVKA